MGNIIATLSRELCNKKMICMVESSWQMNGSHRLMTDQNWHLLLSSSWSSAGGVGSSSISPLMSSSSIFTLKWESLLLLTTIEKKCWHHHQYYFLIFQLIGISKMFRICWKIFNLSHLQRQVKNNETCNASNRISVCMEDSRLSCAREPFSRKMNILFMPACHHISYLILAARGQTCWIQPFLFHAKLSSFPNMPSK